MVYLDSRNLVSHHKISSALNGYLSRTPATPQLALSADLCSTCFSSPLYACHFLSTRWPLPKEARIYIQ